MISQVFHQGPLGLAFAPRKNGGVLLLRVIPGSSAEHSLLRRGMLLCKINNLELKTATTETLPGIIKAVVKQKGFPITLSFIPAPKRSDENIRQAMLLKKVQRVFKRRLEQRKRKIANAAAEESAKVAKAERSTMPLPVPPRPNKIVVLKSNLRQPSHQHSSASVPVPLPPRPGTAPTNSIQQRQNTITKLLPNRCSNCGQISNYPSVRLRALFRCCGLCKLQFSHLTPHPVLYVPDIIQPMPVASARGPEHSIFTEKQTLQLHVLAASLGSSDLPQRALDITVALNQCIALLPFAKEGPSNYIELKSGFNCSTHLLAGATLKDREVDDERNNNNNNNNQLSPRSDSSLRSNPCILYSRWELKELSGLPFRRWTTKQNVIINKQGELVIEGPSIVLQPPLEPMLRVLPTSFLGNPNDHHLQYPVAEHIQGVIDLDVVKPNQEQLYESKNQNYDDDNDDENGNTSTPDHKDGSWLIIGPKHSQLIRDIGDPYPGADKTLRLDLDMVRQILGSLLFSYYPNICYIFYYISLFFLSRKSSLQQGFSGEIVVPSSSGHLHQPININGPVLAPTLVIRKARYGAVLQFDPDAPTRRSDIPNFDPARSVNVTSLLQKLVDDSSNGESLTLNSSDVSMEHLLQLKEDPAPNSPKKLEFIYDRRGIRGRKIITISKNGFMQQGESHWIKAPKLQDSRANIYASASRKFGFSCPNIIIKSASYGTALGVRSARRLDVRRVLQNRCDNSLRNNFSLGIEENLVGRSIFVVVLV